MSKSTKPKPFKVNTPSADSPKPAPTPDPEAAAREVLERAARERREKFWAAFLSMCVEHRLSVAAELESVRAAGGAVLTRVAGYVVVPYDPPPAG